MVRLRVAAPVLLLLGLLIAPAAPAMGGIVELIVGKDHTFTFSTGAAGPTRFDLALDRWADTNNDGDLADAGEQTSLITLSDVTTCAGASAHLACIMLDGSQTVLVLWKNASTHQAANFNYSLRVTFENNIGQALDRDSRGIRLRNDTAAAEGSRTRSELATHDTNMRNAHDGHAATLSTHDQDHQAHEGRLVRVDSNVTRLDGNVTAHNGTGGGDPISHASFTSDCHGSPGQLCVNGHAENAAVADLTAYALIGAALVGWAWLMHRPSTGPRVVGLVFALGLAFVLMRHGRFIADAPVPVGALLFLAAVAMVVFSVLRVFAPAAEEPGEGVPA